MNKDFEEKSDKRELEMEERDEVWRDDVARESEGLDVLRRAYWGVLRTKEVVVPAAAEWE